MKSAVIAAIVAAVVASGAAYAGTRISGRSIAPHSIPADRITQRAVKSFTSEAPPAVVAANVTGTIDYTDLESVVTTGTQGVTVEAACPDGEVAVSGGYTLGEAAKIATVTEDGAKQDRTGWEVTLVEATSQDVTVYAACEPAG